MLLCCKLLKHYLEGFKAILDRELLHLIYMLFRADCFKPIFSSLVKHKAYLFALYHSLLKYIVAFKEWGVFSYLLRCILFIKAEIGVVWLGLFFLYRNEIFYAAFL